MDWINNKTLLTPTGGFLKKGFTHTVNIYSGCSFAKTVCGTFCYAQQITWTTKGRPWSLYGAKKNIREAYQREYERIKNPRRGIPKSLSIYMSSITDPYVPQEQTLHLTSSLLEEMACRPPDVLVLQTHSNLIQRDFNLIKNLAERCKIWVSITIETDMEAIPGFPPHAFSPNQRAETLKTFLKGEIPTQATVSPLLPLADPIGFAHLLDTCCDRVILDHFLIGDGSNGKRTLRTDFAERLKKGGNSEWAKLEKLWEVQEIFQSVLGKERVLVSQEGFNAV